MNCLKIKNIKIDEIQAFTNCNLNSSNTEGRLISINEKYLSIASKSKGEINIIDFNNNTMESKSISNNSLISLKDKPNIYDIEFSPFYNNIIAVANENTDYEINSVIISKVKEESKKLELNVLANHKHNKRKVNFVNFNPVTSNIICSSSLFRELHIWDLNVPNKYQSAPEFENDQNLTFLSWSPNGNLIGISRKKGFMNIYDPRQNNFIIKNTQINEFTNNVKFYWLDNDNFVAVGKNDNNKRMIGLYDIRNQDKKIISYSKYEIDSFTQALLPYVDHELKLIYAVGKDKSDIQIFDYSKSTLNKIKKQITPKDTNLFSALYPRKFLDKKNFEFDRIIRCNNKNISYISLKLTNIKNSDFDEELYPNDELKINEIPFNDWIIGKNIEINDNIKEKEKKEIQYVNNNDEQKIKLAQDKNDENIKKPKDNNPINKIENEQNILKVRRSTFTQKNFRKINLQQNKDEINNKNDNNPQQEKQIKTNKLIKPNKNIKQDKSNITKENDKKIIEKKNINKSKEEKDLIITNLEEDKKKNKEINQNKNIIEENKDIKNNNDNKINVITKQIEKPEQKDNIETKQIKKPEQKKKDIIINENLLKEKVEIKISNPAENINKNQNNIIIKQPEIPIPENDNKNNKIQQKKKNEIKLQDKEIKELILLTKNEFTEQKSEIENIIIKDKNNISQEKQENKIQEINEKNEINIEKIEKAKNNGKILENNVQIIKDEKKDIEKEDKTEIKIQNEIKEKVYVLDSNTKKDDEAEINIVIKDKENNDKSKEQKKSLNNEQKNLSDKIEYQKNANIIEQSQKEELISKENELIFYF